MAPLVRSLTTARLSAASSWDQPNVNVTLQFLDNPWNTLTLAEHLRQKQRQAGGTSG